MLQGLCTRCGQFPPSPRKGVAAGLCCNRCPHHGPWCSSRLEEIAPRPRAAPKTRHAPAAETKHAPAAKAKHAPAAQTKHAPVAKTKRAPAASLQSQSKKPRNSAASGASPSSSSHSFLLRTTPGPPGSQKRFLLPARHGTKMRNLTQELQTAKADPKLAEIRRVQEIAVSKDFEMKRQWAERTKFLAIGGQAHMDVASKQAALERSEAEAAKAKEAVEAARIAIQQKTEGLDEDAATRASDSDDAVAAALHVAQLAEKRARLDSCALEKAKELKALDEQRLVIQSERQKADAVLREALSQVKALNHELTASLDRTVEVDAAFTAVRGPIASLATAQTLGAVEGLVTAEWCVSLLQQDGAELVVDVTSLSAVIPDDSQTHGSDTNVVLRLEPLPADDSEGVNCVACYASITCARAAEIVDLATKKQPVCVHSLQLLRAWLGLEPEVRLAPEVALALERLLLRPRLRAMGALGPEHVRPPAKLKAKLRPYQVLGFSWMASNVESGLGSLLADDMGLGKTLQTIALILHLKDQGRLVKPVLVVTPLSVLNTWSEELACWAPSLRCQIHHGAGRSLPRSCMRVSSDADNTSSDTCDILLTTYSTLREDSSLMVDVAQFGAMVLDESQAIKNRASQTTRAVLEVADSCTGPVRLALTGTPVENRLAELHSIFGFVLPGYFGSSKQFEKEFAKPLERLVMDDEATSQRAIIRDRLLHALRPFLLRRCKSDKAVAGDLPPKIELVHSVELSSGQKTLYEAVKKAALKDVMELEPESGEQPLELGAMPCAEGGDMQEPIDVEPTQPLAVRASKVLAMLHALQQVCNHPAVLGASHWPSNLDREESRFGNASENSGKLMRLVDILDEVLETARSRSPHREKVLIFTQYVATLQLLKLAVETAHPAIEVLTFHGGLQLTQREEVQKRFRLEPRCAVLIMTLGCGGVGLNLAEASHVVHFDRCWNPAKEAQATDRAHRIGQCRTVVVHRFLSQGTFEERLAVVLSQKMQLAGEVLPGDGRVVDISSFSVEELLQFFTGSDPEPRT